MKAGHESDSLILLVDDDASVRRIAALSLKKLGYRVIQASDGESALAMLENGDYPVRLVLSDVRMPGLTGDELARIISRRWPAIPVLLTSGHAKKDDFPDIDAVQLLSKPYSRSALAQAVSSALQTH